jgi:hypothetical protein
MRILVERRAAAFRPRRWRRDGPVRGGPLLLLSLLLLGACAQSPPPPPAAAVTPSPAVTAAPAPPVATASLTPTAALPTATRAAAPVQPAASPTPPRAPTAAPTGSRLGYGFNGFFTFHPVHNLPDLRRSLDLVREADFGWVRQQLVWATLEPKPGEYDTEQLATFDAIVREATQRRLRVMLSVAKAPRWAVASDGHCHGDQVKLCGLPQDPKALARVLGFLADRYKEGSPYGRVHAWEVWNEQNTGGETGNNVDAGAYVELLVASHAAIKAADPKATVVFGGLTPTGVNDKKLAIDDVVYLEQAYAYKDGLVKRAFDVLGAHPGSNNNPPDALFPEQPGPGTGCPQAPRCWRDHPSFYFRRIEHLRAVMERHGDAAKPMWLTEFGWTTKNEAPGYEYGAVISEELQAQYLVRAFEKARADYPWMGVMFVWTLNHSVVVPPGDEKHPWSVIRADWSPRPAYTALKAMPKAR